MSSICHCRVEKDILDIYNMPLLELVYKAATVHRKFHEPSKIQLNSLMSIKSGRCSEDCAYCPQSARYKSGIVPHALLPLDVVVKCAKRAKKSGATRFCIGAAWRQVKDGPEFERVLQMIRAISGVGMEVCCTLGMLTESQAKRLAEAGLHSYNHNIDTSKEYYSKIVTTHSYDERLRTLNNVRKAGIKVCCGGIIGMGESIKDRAGMLLTLSSLSPPPESVPINALIPVKGTPLGNQKQVSVWDIVRTIATARIVMPRSVIRLSAGRVNMNEEGHALCFLAGANSIFIGDVLLTQSNPRIAKDFSMLKRLGLEASKLQ